jgi:hypothetical protein
MLTPQGIILGPEESLPTGEEGHFDFLGDLEGVLQVKWDKKSATRALNSLC